jgi:hypothetical protein
LNEDETAECLWSVMIKFVEEGTFLPLVVLISSHHIAILLEEMKKLSSELPTHQSDVENVTVPLLLHRIENIAYLLRLLEVCFTNEQWTTLPYSNFQ